MSAWSILGFAILGQAGAGSAPDAAAVQVQSVWDFVVKGGPMMIPIGICSALAVAVIVERLITLKRAKVIPAGFMDGLRPTMRDRSNGFTAAVEYCKRDGSPIANIFAAGIRSLGSSVEIVEKHIEQAGQREILNLRKYLRTLSVIASIAPLLGLLGTIFGMIDAFQTVAASGEALGRTELLAKGIYQAMITTAAGLSVAIPVLVGYHGLSSRIERLVAEMDQMTVEFVQDHAIARSAGERANSTPVTKEISEVRKPKVVDESDAELEAEPTVAAS